MQTGFFKILISIAVVLLLTALVGQGRAEVSELDKEGVFCAYYFLKKDVPGDAEIEDLCWSLQRPLFSKFKPAEMFSKKGLKGIRNRLSSRISGFDGETLFRWKIKGNFKKTSKKGVVAFTTGFDRKCVPQATPHIQSEVSQKGWRRLKRVLKEMPLAPPTQVEMDSHEIGILLRPEHINDRTQKRNVAMENVIIPIRYVVFVPVAIEPPPVWGHSRIMLTR
jgi:hypothetical protein